MLRRVLLVVLCLYGVSLHAQTTQELTFSDALVQTRSPLVFSNGSVSGAGAEVLSHAIASSRFVLLGEDHFSKETPQLASAMCDMMHPDAYAVEVGPDAAHFVNGLLKSPNRIEQVRERNAAHPGNMAFLDRQEENDLAAHCAAASHNPHFELWGLDQEFVGSAGTLLEAMVATHPGPESLRAITATQMLEREAQARALASGKVEQLFLLSSTNAEVQPLQRAIALDGNAATKDILFELITSRHIYQMALQRLPDANRVRAQLLKRHFMDDYTRFKAQHSEPRIFVKFGGMHAGKGFSFIHQRDLGNFVAEIADLEQSQSLHVFVMGVRGVHTYPGAFGKPIVPQPFDLNTDPEWNWLAPALAQTFPQQTGISSNTLTLFDLRQLRFRQLDMPPGWEHFIYSYDFLALTPGFTAATVIQ